MNRNPIRIAISKFIAKVNISKFQIRMILTLFMLCVNMPLVAQDAETKDSELSLKQMLLTPGDLTQAHAKFEAKCEKCHVHFDKSNQAPLCLDCHEVIQKDLKESLGFHGHMSLQDQSDCQNCHSDHRGRDFDIRGLDLENFDHSRTSFDLEGMHKNIPCGTCHVSENRVAGNSQSHTAGTSTLLESLPTGEGFRFESSTCDACHTDVHKGEMEQACDSCHNESSWETNQFDHSTTDFMLDGQHKNLQCSSCHFDNDFKKAEPKCQSCHLSRDSHLGVFGTDCASCHTTEKWDNQNYDHFKETGYKLVGSHAGKSGKPVACISCHEMKLNPEKKCVSCHLKDDVHQSANGSECQDCHNQSHWDKTEFVHDFETTQFPLTGAHKSVTCETCHIPGTQRLGDIMPNMMVKIRECIDCHRAVDPHFTRLGEKCSSCHTTSDWSNTESFNHDFTDFPLTASHQLLVCESCHASNEFAHESGECVACHKDDDIHKGTLGDQCLQCHDTSVWSHWQFDHQVETNFSLEGAHRELSCQLCHTVDLADPKKPGADCFSCHQTDDVHNGGFGTDCQQCHSQQKFDDLDF